MTFFFSSRLLTDEMASFLVLGGRVLFFALIMTQSLMLAAYPATYKDDSNWYAVATSQAPSVSSDSVSCCSVGKNFSVCFISGVSTSSA